MYVDKRMQDPVLTCSLCNRRQDDIIYYKYNRFELICSTVHWKNSSLSNLFSMYVNSDETMVSTFWKIHRIYINWDQIGKWWIFSMNCTSYYTSI